MTIIYHHKTVLINETLQYLNIKPHGIYVDVTFGGGGHTRAILESDPTVSVIALDWDQEAIDHNAPAFEEKYGERFKIFWGSFAHLYKILKKNHIKEVDGILADFGTSQHQIHHKAGFSFQTDTPLDMRMSVSHQTVTAADIVNNTPFDELVDIFSAYGQEPKSKTIAQAIVNQRKIKRFITTGQLVALIESIINPRAFKAKRGIHPATQVFQALRIAVNNEFENIQSLLMAASHFLKPQGRIVCISFHSLEDRMVKNFFKDHTDKFKTITTKPVIASDEEIAINASSRSAKLRAAEKC